MNKESRSTIRPSDHHNPFGQSWNKNRVGMKYSLSLSGEWPPVFGSYQKLNGSMNGVYTGRIRLSGQW